MNFSDKRKPRFQKREQIKKKVRNWIKSKSLEPGSPLCSETELARQFKVNPLTAHKALVELAEEGVVYRERGKGTFVGPKPETEKTPLSICMVSSQANTQTPEVNPSGWHLTQCLFQALSQNLHEKESWTNIVISPETPIDEAVSILKKYTALVFYGYTVNEKLIKVLREREIAPVIVFAHNNAASDALISSSIDIKESVYQGIKYLAEKGYREIAYVGSDMVDKFEGYRNALEDYGLEFDESRVVRGVNQHSEGTRGASVLLGRKNTSFDAVFVDTDFKAAMLIDYFKNQGIDVPGDVGVMGFDGVTPFGYYASFSKLTTVKLGYEKLLIQNLELLRSGNLEMNKQIILSEVGEVIPGQTSR